MTAPKEKNGLNPELIYEKIKNIETSIVKIEKKLEKDYCTQAELMLLKNKIDLLQKIVFGFVGLILVGVVGSLLTLIMK